MTEEYAVVVPLEDGEPDLLIPCGDNTRRAGILSAHFNHHGLKAKLLTREVTISEWE